MNRPRKSIAFPQFVFTLALVLILTACAPAAATGLITALPTIAPNQAPSAPPRATFTPAPTRPVILPMGTTAPDSTLLAPGFARQIALSTDVPMQPTPRTRINFESEPVTLSFAEFYDGYDIRTGLKLSDKLVSLDGRNVTLQGYMAPPLKPNLDFFVVTRVRLAFCPFCSTAADWPDDIALVYMPADRPARSVTEPIRLTGRLDVGQNVDQETGMVSLVRIYAEQVEVLK